MQLLVYSEKNSPRLDYVLSILLKQLLGVDYQLINDRTFFENSALPKINYSRQRLNESENFLFSTPLLFEKGIKFQSIKPISYKNLPAFFAVSDKKADLPFDIFAATFYLLSRYEEYLPFSADTHGRFSARESLAYQNNFLHLPLINLWSWQLKDILIQKYPNLQFSQPTYQFQPTYDIDFAWSFLYKGFFRSLGGYAVDLFRLHFSQFKERLLVQLHQKTDPFYTFDYLDSLHQRYQLQPVYFFLLGDYGKFDKNTPVTNKQFQHLIQTISQRYQVGIHPSFQSNSAIETLAKERNRLEKISQKKVTHSRQHFLKLTLPQTYRNLLELGIKNDYTMGYAAAIGFRASIAQPFLWYDLEKETVTDLTIHSFQIMDVTLQQYLQFSPEIAIQQSLDMINTIKSVGGTFVSLWHNSSFSDEKKWLGWQTVYEKILAAASPNK